MVWTLYCRSRSQVSDSPHVHCTYTVVVSGRPMPPADAVLIVLFSCGYRRLSYRHPDCPVAIMVSMDSTIQITDLVNAATGKEIRSGQSYGTTYPGSPDPQRQPQQLSGQWKPVVVMMPARYGLDKLKEGYVANLKQLFKLPQFLGIAGGRPGRSLYFVAYQGTCCHDNCLRY